MEIKYLIGIDFGAGETSASYYDVCGNQSPNNTTRLHHLSIVPTGDVSKIYSAIKLVNGEWRLVTDPTDFMCTDLRVDFKRRPSKMDSEQRDSNIKFFRMVFKSILESNRTFLSFNDVTGEKNFLLLVARPTSWSEEDENEYLALMKEAGLPVDLVVKESEAALTKWSQKALHGNTLVVDCGSSTIDLTLVQNGKLYDGPLYSCIPPKGAKRVEELLKEYLEQDEQYVSDCKDVQRKLLERNINLNLDEAIKLFLRNNKERFYTNTPEAIELSLKKRPFIGEKGDVIDVVLTRNELEKIVSPYFDELREFFKNVKDNLLNSGIVVEKLILSGGASRMPLVKQILSEVFAINGNDDEVFFHDKASADYVVSDGLALSINLSTFIASDYQIYEENGRYGIMHKMGISILPCEYAEIESIEQDGSVIIGKTLPDNSPRTLAIYGEPREHLVKGLYNIPKRQVIIESQYSQLYYVPGTTLVVVYQEGFYGVYNRIGDLVIPLKYISLHCSKELSIAEHCDAIIFFACNHEGKWGFIDKQGNEISFVYDRIEFYVCSYHIMVVQKLSTEGRLHSGLFDIATMTEVLPCMHDEIPSYFNIQGHWRSYIHDFQEGYYIIDEQARKCSKIYKNLRLVIGSPIGEGYTGWRWEQFSLI